VVTSITGDETEDAATYTSFTVKAQKDIEISDGLQKSLTVFSLTNITTSKRIWNALHMFGNLNIIKEILCTDSVVRDI
jgi:senataxin